MLALVPVVAPLLGGTYPLTVAGRIMIFAIAAVSLDLILGYGGLVSFGHAAFIGLGAYAVGILMDAGLEEGLLLLPAAMLAAAVFAAADRRRVAEDPRRALHHDHPGLRPDGLFHHDQPVGLWRR